MFCPEVLESWISLFLPNPISNSISKFVDFKISRIQPPFITSITANLVQTIISYEGDCQSVLFGCPAFTLDALWSALYKSKNINWITSLLCLKSFNGFKVMCIIKSKVFTMSYMTLHDMIPGSFLPLVTVLTTVPQIT